MLTVGEIAADLKVTPQTIGRWRRRGLITGRRPDGRGECLFPPGQQRPGPAEQTAARRPAGTQHLLTSRQLAASLGVTASTILRWTQLGLVTIAATGNHGFNLYQPSQPHPTRDQITAACRPPGTADAITVPGSSPPGTVSAAPLSTNGTSSDSSAPSAPTAPAGTSTSPASNPPAPNRSVPPAPPATTAPETVRPPCHYQFRKAQHTRSPHPASDHQHEVQCEARSLVTPVSTAAAIWSCQREVVRARVSSSGMSSLRAHQS